MSPFSSEGAVAYDTFVHPAIQDQGNAELERELDERLAPILLAQYLRQKAVAEKAEQVPAK